jgi:hypothetical protein
MDFGAGPLARPSSRNRLALGFTFGLHLLAGLLWMQQRPVVTVQPVEVFSILLQPPRSVVPKSVPVPAPLPVRRRAPALPPPLAAPVTAPAAEAPAETIEAPAPAAEAAAPATPGFSLELAKRQSGAIDRALRKGKSGVPVEADTPMARFRHGVEAAYDDRSYALTMDSYTSPDGIIIYRFRQGNRVRCRQTGGVAPAGMKGVGTAGDVSCPKGVTWTREP